MADYASVLALGNLDVNLQGTSRLDDPTVFWAQAREPDNDFVHASPVDAAWPAPPEFLDMACNIGAWYIGA